MRRSSRPEPRSQPDSRPPAFPSRRESRLREANHRFANHLAIIHGMVSLQLNAIRRGPETLGREDVVRSWEALSSKIMAMGELHRMLSQQPDSDLIDLSRLLTAMIDAMKSTVDSRSALIVRNRMSRDCLVSSEQAQTLMMITNEIITNSLKYAHPTGLPLIVTIAGKEDGDHRLHYEVGDDGIGLPEGFDPQRDGGIGFNLIRSMAAQLYADLEFDSGPLGLTVRLRVPTRETAKRELS